VDNEINNNNRHSLRSNTKGYGGKTHWTDTAPSGRELYHLQFSRQTASPETFGYTHVDIRIFLLDHRKNEDILEEHELDLVENKLAQCKQKIVKSC
jgi:hypothetical protein